MVQHLRAQFSKDADLFTQDQLPMVIARNALFNQSDERGGIRPEGTTLEISKRCPQFIKGVEQNTTPFRVGAKRSEAAARASLRCDNDSPKV